MRRIITMMAFAIVALCAVSCEKTTEEEEVYTLSGDKFTGTLTVMGTNQEDIIFYADQDDDAIDILMPEVTFMSGFMPTLDMALTSIPLVSENPDTYYVDNAQMVGIYDRLPLINDIIQSISNINVIESGDDITVTFNCSISTTTMGDMTVPVVYSGSIAD